MTGGYVRERQAAARAWAGPRAYMRFADRMAQFREAVATIAPLPPRPVEPSKRAAKVRLSPRDCRP